MVSSYAWMNTDSENPTRHSTRGGHIRISVLQAKNIIAGASYLGPILFLALHRSILEAFITYELDWPKWLGFVWHAHRGPTMTVKLMTGENLKSPPLLLLPHQIWYICKPCWLLLLSRARSSAFGLAVATTRRSSCERCLKASEESEHFSSGRLGALRQRWAQGPCDLPCSWLVSLCHDPHCSQELLVGFHGTY